MKIIGVLAFLTMIAGFVGLFAGLIRPKLFQLNGKEVPTRKRVLLVGIAVLVVSMVLINATSDAPKEALADASVAATSPASTKIPVVAKTPEKQVEVYKVTAQQLHQNYEANEVATDEYLKGRIVEISGSVQSIDKDMFDNIVVQLRTSNQFMSARMQMQDSEKQAAIRLGKGQKIKVRCEKVMRLMGSPSGSDCRFS